MNVVDFFKGYRTTWAISPKEVDHRDQPIPNGTRQSQILRSQAIKPDLKPSPFKLSGSELSNTASQ